MSAVEILQKFGDFISALGTQPVTIPLREIVYEMIESYTTVTQGLEPFCWAASEHNLVPILEDFVRAQEIFFHPVGREPVMEVHFSVRKWYPDSIDLEFYVTWNPTLAGFEGLKNVITEGRDLRIKPVFHEPNNLPPDESREALVPTTSSFSVSVGDESWLDWMY